MGGHVDKGLRKRRWKEKRPTYAERARAYLMYSAQFPAILCLFYVGFPSFRKEQGTHSLQ